MPHTSGVSRVFKLQLAVGEALDSLHEHPVQHQERLVHTNSADFVWPFLGLDGEYIYLANSSIEALLPICSAEKHLVVQGRSKSLERI